MHLAKFHQPTPAIILPPLQLATGQYLKQKASLGIASNRINPLRANPTKWSNKLKQFAGNS